MLSLVMATARRSPGYQLICDSIAEAAKYFALPFEFVCIDEGIWYREKECRQELQDAIAGRFPFQHHSPKPTVWRGPFRLTNKDYWDKQSALNTAVCYAKYPRLAFFDDNAVLPTNFLASHLINFPEPIALCGAYRYWYPGAKAWWNAEVGLVMEGTPHQPGDHRLAQAVAGPCESGWLFGGNVSFPLESILQCNGWEELLSGSGGLEDSEFSVRISRVARSFFDPNCIVNYLSDNNEIVGDYVGKSTADVHSETPSRCKGFSYKDPQGTIHWMTFNHLPIWTLTAHKLTRHEDGVNFKPMYDPKLDVHRTRFRTIGNRFDLRALRNFIQRGGRGFPIPVEPTYDWRDHQRLDEM